MASIASWLRRHCAAFLLLAVVGSIYTTTQKSFGMFMWDEAEYAVLARSVLRGEGFSISGRPNQLRPPVLPLAGAASMWLHGEADDSSAKLATLALTLLALAIVYATTSVAFDTTTGLFAAFLLAAAPELWTMTAQFLSEIPFLAFFSAAVLSFELGLRRSPRWFWLSWPTWALALLTRYTATLFAPFVLVRLAVSLLFRREGEWSRIRSAAFALAPVVGLLLVLPWLLRQQVVFGDALIGFKKASQQLQVYVPGVSMPWYFYLANLPDMLSPATTILLAFGAVWAMWRRDGVAFTCTLVIVGILMWFSVYRYKEIRLVTSILPFAAIVAAAGIAQILHGRWRWCLVPIAGLVFVWNQSLVTPRFAKRITLGYPPLLQALQFVHEHSSKGEVVMGASVPQIVWYADRPVIDFPPLEELAGSLSNCEWVVFTSFERGQKPYVADMAKQLLAVNAPGDVIPFSDQRFAVLVVRAAFIRQHLPPRKSG